MLLHETAVSWIRKYLKFHPVKFTEDKQANRQRVIDALQDAVHYANTCYEVEDLCMAFPERLKVLEAKEGERCKW